MFTNVYSKEEERALKAACDKAAEKNTLAKEHLAELVQARAALVARMNDKAKEVYELKVKELPAWGVEYQTMQAELSGYDAQYTQARERADRTQKEYMQTALTLRQYASGA